MEAVTDYCSVDTSLRQIVTICVRENVSGLQFLSRFGFDAMVEGPGCLLGDEDQLVVYLRRSLR